MYIKLVNVIHLRYTFENFTYLLKALMFLLNGNVYKEKPLKRECFVFDHFEEKNKSLEIDAETEA